MAIGAALRGNVETLQHVSRAVGASADITVAVSDLAVQMLNTTASGLSVMSTMAWSITTTSAGAVEASWRGIDLHNITVSRAQGKLIADNLVQVQTWLNSSEGRGITGCQSDAARSVWLQALSTLLQGVPAVASSHDFLDVHGTLTRVVFSTSWVAADEVLFQYEFINASFTPQWANRLWALLQMPWEDEGKQIAGLLDDLVKKMPVSPLLEHRIGALNAPLSGSVYWAIRRRQAFLAAAVLCRYETLLLWDTMTCILHGDGIKMVAFLFAAWGVYSAHRRGIFKTWQANLEHWFQAQFGIIGEG